MRFFVIYRHSYPDSAPYARILKALTESFVREGHEVTVFCAQPSYNDRRAPRRPWREVVCGVAYIRMPLLWENKRFLVLRLVNSLLFLIGALLYGLVTRRMDATMTVTSPPVFMGAIGWLVAHARGCRFLYHCQDIHPEAAVCAGVLTDGWMARLMTAIDNASIRRADLVVVLSEEMREAIRVRGLDICRVEILNNFYIRPNGQRTRIPRPLERKPGTFRVLFAGNIGLFQGLGDIISAAHLLSHIPSIEFLFVGDGAACAKLRHLAGPLLGRTVHFHPFVPEAEAVRIMQESDLGVVSLKKEIYRYAYPSKAITLISCGCPLLVVMEAESSLAQLVESEQIGHVCPPGDVQGIVEAILRARRQGPSREQVIDVAERHFDSDGALRLWSHLIRRRIGESGARLVHATQPEKASV